MGGELRTLLRQLGYEASLNITVSIADLSRTFFICESRGLLYKDCGDKSDDTALLSEHVVILAPGAVLCTQSAQDPAPAPACSKSTIIMITSTMRTEVPWMWPRIIPYS